MFHLAYRFSFVILSLIYFISCAGSSSPTKEILIGTLLASSQGADIAQKDSLAAVDMAITDINQALQKEGNPLRLKTVRGFSEKNPDHNLASLKKLYNQGVRYVVGPTLSKNLIATKAFADENGIIIVSNGSTAPILAIQDNLYRFLPNDMRQTEILARQIREDQFNNIIIFFRKDIYGEGFRNYLKKFFEAQGGKVVAEIAFNPKTSNLEQPVEFLSELIKSSGVSGTDTAIVQIATTEITSIVQEMIKQNEPLFSSFRFYAGDGVAQVEEVIMNPKVAEFFIKTQLKATTPIVPDTAKFQEFSKRFQAATTHLPSAQSTTAYDAVSFLLKVAENETYSKDKLSPIAKNIYGISGQILLDKNGDRTNLPYALYGIIKTGSAYEWKQIKIFNWVIN